MIGSQSKVHCGSAVREWRRAWRATGGGDINVDDNRVLNVVGLDGGRSSPGSCHKLLMHAQNSITVPCGLIEACQAARSVVIMRADLDHL